MTHSLFIERRVLSDLTIDLVSCTGEGSLVYRVIHTMDPAQDRKRVIRDLAVLDPEMNALRDRCAECRFGEHRGESVLDGVSYVVRCGGRVLALFCPERSTDPSIAALGRCLDAFFGKLGSA